MLTISGFNSTIHNVHTQPHGRMDAPISRQVTHPRVIPRVVAKQRKVVVHNRQRQHPWSNQRKKTRKSRNLGRARDLDCTQVSLYKSIVYKCIVYYVYVKMNRLGIQMILKDLIGMNVGFSGQLPPLVLGGFHHQT